MKNTTARIGMSTTRLRAALDTTRPHCYIHRHGGVAKLVIALACQAGGRGFKSRRSRSFSKAMRWRLCTAAPSSHSGADGAFFSCGARWRISSQAGCSAVGSAFGSGPKGRRFKPAQPDSLVTPLQ